MTFRGEQLACLTACHSITPGSYAEEGEVNITLEWVQEGYGLGGQEVDHPSRVRESEESRIWGVKQRGDEPSRRLKRTSSERGGRQAVCWQCLLDEVTWLQREFVLYINSWYR